MNEDNNKNINELRASLINNIDDLYDIKEEQDIFIKEKPNPIDLKIKNSAQTLPIKPVEPKSITITEHILPKEEDKPVPKENPFHNSEQVRNITRIDKEIFSDDALENDEKIKFSINKKIAYTFAILLFVSVLVVVVKAFYFGNKVDHYEEFFTEITEKEEREAKIYADVEIDNETLKKVAAADLINCISSPINTNELPDSVTNIIKEINNYYNQSNNYFAFAYKDIFTGFTVSYNANQNIFTASAIKAPTDIYIWEMASKGKVNLDEIVTYTGNYYNTGSGVLKNKPINTKYNIRTLLQYSTVDSDNAAHNMLMDKYGRTNMLKFWQEKGTNAIFTANNNWGVFNAHDCLIYMEELYRFYANDKEYGEAVMNNFLKSYPKFNKGLKDYKIASKSGWSGTALHDVSIIFADNPYILVSLSNMGTGSYGSYFNKASDLAGRLHNEYWKYKINTCSNIKQYN